MDFKLFLLKNKYLFILIFIGIFFIFIYSWLYQGDINKFSSPDETANYFFANLFANESQLKYEQPHSDVTYLVKPRSTSSVNGYVVPGSFVGMTLVYGFLAKIFGTGAIIYFTPIFSVIGVIFFYLLLKKVFKKNIAFISSLVLFFLPPYFLYSSRGMFHNVFFMSTFIISLYFFIQGFLSGNTKKKLNYKIIYFLGSGIFLSISILTRTSEIIWLLLVFVIIVFIYRKGIKLKYILAWLVPLIIALILFLVINHNVYGDVFNFTKSNILPDNQAGLSESTSSPGNVWSQFIKYLSPYGFDKQVFSFSFSNYILFIFPWFSLLLIIGLFYVLKNPVISLLSRFTSGFKKLEQKINKEVLTYAIIYLFVCLWLLFYYGSYALNEYLDSRQIILGSSYLRYWLPIYVLGLPLVFYGLFRILGYFKNEYFRKLVTFLIISVICMTSIIYVFIDPLHGLKITKDNHFTSQNLSDKANMVIDTNSVIISGDADKIFFPDRQVIYKLSGNKREKDNIVTELLRQTDVYYYYNPLDSESDTTLKQLKDMHIIFEKNDFLSNDLKTMYKLR